jgi:hypothetical protein
MLLLNVKEDLIHVLLKVHESSKLKLGITAEYISIWNDIQSYFLLLLFFFGG